MDIKKLLRSFTYAFDGLKLAVTLDQNVRVHLIVGSSVLVLTAFLGVTGIELLFIVFAIFFVIIAEMVNTAIEEMTNLIKMEHTREARIAKDVAAASVLLAATFSVIVGAVILLPKVVALF